LLHKSDAGDVRRGCEEPEGKSAERLTGVLVQPMGSGGTGVIIGVAREPVSGPVVMHGPGGAAARVLSGHSARPAPLTGAGDLIRPGRAAPLLPGRRGAPAAGLTAVSDTLLRVSRLAGDLSSRCDPAKQQLP
jgi:acetyltransferase